MSERNAGDEIARLTERLKEECEKVGLTLRQAAFVPNLDGGHHMLQALFTVDGEGEVVDPDQARIDAEFQEMLLGERQATREQQVREAREALQKRLDSGGLLDEDEDEDDAPPDSTQ
jgi:hypothetical protein